MGSNKVLIVEESYDISYITEKIFQFQNWQVIKASSGEEALSFLISNIVDVILMDIRLPGMSGYQCCEQIRGFEDRLKSNIPIIAVTGNADNLSLREFRERGFNYFFQKPVNFESLVEKIKEFLEKK